MSSDPAELVFFGELSSKAVFDEAERLGIAAENLQDEQTRQRVMYSRLVQIRTETAESVAVGLDIAITAEQAEAIARNSLVPEVCADPAPLSSEQRVIAEELYFHAIRAAVARHEGSITDKAARTGAKKMIAAGERGLTGLQRLSRAVGCLVVVGAIGIAAATSAVVLVVALVPSA